MAASRSITVYGAGAVGGYLGGKLAPGALDVTLVARPRVAEAVEARGLILREAGREEVTQPRVVTSAKTLAPCDLVILTVRTYDVERSIPDLRRLMGERGLLLAMQNGVGTEETLADALGRGRVLTGTLTVSAGMESPGIITRYSWNGGIALASMNRDAISPWIVESFKASGLPTLVLNDYRSLRWSKLLLNILGAPSSAILDMDMAALMADPGIFRLEQRAFQEATRVMDAQGIRAVRLPGYPVPTACLVMRLPSSLAHRLLGPRLTRARAGHSPTMRSDIQRGRTEIDTLNGAVAAAGERLGIPTPVNTAFTALVRDLAEHPERRAEFRGKPERLGAAVAG